LFELAEALRSYGHVDEEFGAFLMTCVEFALKRKSPSAVAAILQGGCAVEFGFIVRASGHRNVFTVGIVRL